MTIDLAKLRALAEAATPGPWATDLPGNWDDVLLGGTSAYCVKASDRAPGSDDEAEANARFIAAANPTTVLALLHEIERVRADRDAIAALYERACAADRAADRAALPRIELRAHCRARRPIDGTDAQALEGAITLTERERDARPAITPETAAAWKDNDTRAVGVVIHALHAHAKKAVSR